MLGATSPRAVRLSRRQRQVLQLLSEGRTNPEIAAALGISLDGAKWHVAAVLEKLDVATRKEAAALWAQPRPTRWSLATLLLRGTAFGATATAAAAGVALSVMVLNNHLRSSSNLAAAPIIGASGYAASVPDEFHQAVMCLAARGISAGVQLPPVGAIEAPYLTLDDVGRPASEVDGALQECWGLHLAPMEVQVIRASRPDSRTQEDARNFVASCVLARGGTVATLTPGDTEISEWMDSEDSVTRIAAGLCIEERYRSYGF